MKKIIKIVVMLVMVVALTGCMKMNVNVEVKSDLTTDVSMELLMEEDMLETYEMDADEMVQQMKDELLSEAELKDAIVKPLEKTIDGSKWVGVSISGISSDDGTMKIEKKDVDGKESIVVTLPMDEMEESMENEMGTTSQEEITYAVNQMKKLGTEMTMTIKMPSNAKCNVGTVDGNTVTIDLLEIIVSGNTADIVISSPLSSGPDLTILFVVIGLALIVGIVVVILKKRKPKDDGVIVDEAIKHCPNCGQEINDEFTCPHCGYEIKK